LPRIRSKQVKQGRKKGELPRIRSKEGRIGEMPRIRSKQVKQGRKKGELSEGRKEKCQELKIAENKNHCQESII
jgi:hypothetical protein